jgi:hypothetical protein
MPEGTRAGGGMPGPVLDAQGAAAARVADAADASSGVRTVATMRTVARCPRTTLVAELGRAGFRLLWIDPEVGDGLRNEVRTVLLAERERV